MLENNIKYIERYNPWLANAIRNHTLIGNCAFDLAESGDVILYYENLPFHSKQDPQQEALDVFNKISETSKSAIIFCYGLGLGYLLKRLYLSSEARIVVFESNMDILRITLENVEFSKELSDPRVMIVNRLEDLDEVFKRYYKYNDPMNICFLSIYQMVFGDKIKELSDKLAFLKGYYNNNFYNLFEMSHEWLEMGIDNIGKVLESQYIDCLRDVFKDKPAVITSAGPSLLKNCDLLKAYQDKCVVFSVGAALRPVINKFGITPDFSAFIDVSEKTLPQLDYIETTSDINFIVQPSTYKDFYDKECKRRFVYLPTNDEFSNWIAKTIKLDNKHYSNRGTVALTALTAAINFGCNPIILIGQDLAYASDGRAYADDQTKNLYKEKDNYEVKGWDGNVVMSNSSFAIFLKYFEIIANQYKDSIKLINATEGGAYIEGFEHITFADALKLLPDEVIDVENIIQGAESNYKNPLKVSKKKVFDALKENKNVLPSLLKIAKESKLLVDNIRLELSTGVLNKNYLLQKFQQIFENNGKIDKIIKSKALLVSPYIQKEAHAFNQGMGRYSNLTNLSDIEDFLRLSNDYYSALVDKVPVLERQIGKIIG